MNGIRVANSNKTQLLERRWQCRCGRVQMRATGEPILAGVCYCDDCQAGGRAIEALAKAGDALDADGGADLTYLGQDAAGQPIYATVSYTEGQLKYYTVASDGMQGKGFSIDYFEG